MRNCTYVLKAILCVLVIAAGTNPGYAQQIETSVTSTTGERLGFLQFTPKSYATEGNVKHPLIIFLHGIGERGNGTTELKNVGNYGLPKMIRDGWDTKTTWNGKTETFIVLSPQCPTSYGMWPQAFVDDLLKYAKANLRVDTDRIYLSGLSMGAGGSNRYLSTVATGAANFAAAGVICTPNTFTNGKYVADAKLPYWAFHAADDNVVSYTYTEAAINRINGAGAEVKPLKTIWPTGGHMVWDRVYKDTNYKWDNTINIYEWFLGQNKRLAVNKLPVARATGTTAITTGTAVTNLSGATSTDADGSIVRYVWKKISGPNAGIIKNIFSPNASTDITGLTTAGTYVYELSVVDNRAGFTRDTISVIVSSGASIPVPNVAPVAKAGNDITITLPVSKVNVNGSSSSDADGTVDVYLWSKVSGPAQFTIVNQAAAATEINNLTEGTYVFNLKVTDNKGATHDDQITVKVNAAPNVAPVAKAGNDITITLPVSKVNVNGSSSSDADGTVDVYLWSKVSGPSQFTIVNQAAAATEINNLTEGTYVFNLKVTDNKGATHDDQITVKVNAAPNVAPVAKAGNDITITLPVSKVNVNGNSSSDADGTVDVYLWSKVSGPAQFTIVNQAAAATEINNLTEGTYVFNLKVTDNKGATHDDQITVKVNAAPNVAPVAKAGNDITITLPVSKVNVNGSSSSDADGTVDVYLWSKVSGPAQFTIVNQAASATEINNLTEGTYVFNLKVTDNKGATHDDQITVKVNAAPNVAPVAKAGNDITITLPVSKVNVNGSSSSDADGTVDVYLWSKVSGPAQFTIVNQAAAATEINNLTEGTYVFNLKVTDNKGATHDDQITVKVNAAPVIPNVAPVAKAGNDITITLPVSKVNVNGSSSSDADGTVDVYLWSKVSGPSQFTIVNQAAAATEINNLTEGTYVFNLKVTDNKGATHDDQITIKVNAAPVIPNVAPVAKAGNDITITLPVSKVNVNGSSSSDADGTVDVYLWSKVSGPAQFTIVNQAAAATEINNLTEGTYVFNLKVTDNKGTTHDDQITVKVNAAPVIPNVAPVAKAGNDITITLPINKVTVNGSASTDSDGTIDTYLWTKTSGPNQFNVVNENASVSEINNLTEGIYVFTLRVTDNKGDSHEDNITVKVNAAAIPPVDPPVDPPPAGENQAPIADAGVDMEVTLPDGIRLNGLNSTDPDGEIVSYSWVQTSGANGIIITNSTTKTPGITGAQEGEYIFALTVIDDKGARSTDEVTVIVFAAPQDSTSIDSIPDANLKFEEKVSVYPNPVASNMNVKYTSEHNGTARVSIYNMNGMLLHSNTGQKNQVNYQQLINVSHLQRGIYYVEVVVDGHKNISKFLKK